MLNAIFYITHSGCPWRLMPREFPHWRLVAKWQNEGVWEKLNAALRDRVRTTVGIRAHSAAALDSQSVKIAGQRGERGFDAGTNVFGAKMALFGR